MIITIDSIFPDISTDLAEIETRFKTESLKGVGQE